MLALAKLPLEIAIPITVLVSFLLVGLIDVFVSFLYRIYLRIRDKR